MAFSKPSPYRCKILTVSRLLSKEDVDEILYLSEDFIPQSEVGQISSGLDLMRSLERHNRVAPGKYSYLLACLKEIGRIDLAKSLTEFIYSCLLESMPSTFRAPCQMYAAKLHILVNKQSRYVEGMRNLQAAAGNLHFWEEWISSTFHHLLKCASSSPLILPEKVDISGLLHLTLESIGNILLPWVGSATVLLQGTSNTQVGIKLHNIQLHKTKLLGDLSEAGLSGLFSWTERPQQLDLAVSAASYALFDFLSELLGKAVDSERVGRLLKALSAIESITPENCAFETLPQLLLQLTKVAVSSSIQFQSCESLLKSLLHNLKNINTVLTVLQGTILEDKVSKIKQELTNEEGNFLYCLPELDACPLVTTTLVCLLALFSVSEITPIHWEKIEMQLLQCLKSQQQKEMMALKCLLLQVCGAMQCELDSFRDTSLTEFVSVIPGENDHLQDLIASVLQY